MRQPRLKSAQLHAAAFYHCVSRVVDRRFVFEDAEKQEFLRLMRLYEKFCKVRVLTYCLMANHFHLLVEVPPQPEAGAQMSEEALLDHIGSCYGARRADIVREEVRQFRKAGAHQAAEEVINSWTSRIGDLSAFMKTLKQRFTQWFNKRHGRRGTLWEDRFRSSLIEGHHQPLAMVAAYIDLNPVRAGLVDDPKDYRWSGYAAAVAGIRKAVQGIEVILGKGAESSRAAKGQRALGAYRVVIYGEGNTGDERSRKRQSELGKGAKGNRRGFDHTEVEKERQREGQLSRAEMLRCRVRYFIDGTVIGSRAFVDALFTEQRHRFGPNRQSGARPMKGADFGGLCALRDLRQKVFG